MEPTAMDESATTPGAFAAPAQGPGGSEAAAILLMMLGDAEAAEILGHLDPHEVQHLGSAMFNVADVSETEVESVFDTFMTQTRERTTIGFAAAPRIRTMMENALGSERAEGVLARITPAASSRALEPLRWIDAKTIAALVEEEHPQVGAVVLAHLDPSVAAEVLQMLSPELQPDVVYRVAKLETISADAIAELELTLVKQIGRLATKPSAVRGGTSEAAKIMNNMRPGTDQQIIRKLGKVDKILAQRIEDEMFIFQDLMELDEKNLGVLLRNVENDVLVVALKGAEPKLRDKMLGCMSARAADSIRDEMAERGPMRLADVHEAQKEVLTVARRLADEGTLMLGGRDDYV
jgi:flagellar motor switch protein FliG